MFEFLGGDHVLNFYNTTKLKESGRDEVEIFSYHYIYNHEVIIGGLRGLVTSFNHVILRV